MNLMYGADSLYQKTLVEPLMFNWRPYWALSKRHQTSIVHFHGPKPLDYINHFEDPSNDMPLFKHLFASCDNPEVSEACKLWIRKWMQLYDKINLGFIPVAN